MTYNAKDLCESLHCTYIYTSPIEKIPKISSSLRKCIKKHFVKKNYKELVACIASCQLQWQTSPSYGCPVGVCT